MIKIVRGDLLQATENIIGHQVNCQGKMNSGVAKSVREVYPKVFKGYMNLVDYNYKEGFKPEALLGRVQGIEVADNKWVVNLFGQENYGYNGEQYTDTTALFECFKNLRRTAEDNNLSVALPYMIGCYRGGADWKEVEELLLTAFDGYEVTLYKLHRG